MKTISGQEIWHEYSTQLKRIWYLDELVLLETFWKNLKVTGIFTVEITATAENDLQEIWEYISRDNIVAPYNLILYIEEQIEKLESSPMHCPLIPENELQDTDYRHLLRGNYRIIFRILGTRVIIMRVFHISRLLEIKF